MDRLSPRWTFVQKFSLDEIKNGLGGGHKTLAHTELSHTTAHGC